LNAPTIPAPPPAPAPVPPRVAWALWLACLSPVLPACAAAPDWAAEPVPPAAWGGDEPPAVCPSGDVTAAELGYSARVWGAREDCDDPAAIAVAVEVIPRDALGTSSREPPLAVLDPRAWSYRPEVTLAHEIGHVLGYAHEAQGCALMAPRLDVRCPGYVAPEGGAYRWR